ncbi:MAG: S1C family serine protease [Vescimonas sp.]
MMYNDEFDRFHNNQYHYGRNSNLPTDDYQPSGSSVSPEEPPRKKQGFFKSTAAKVIAIVLACAIIGTGCGFGGAALYRNSTRQTVTLQQSDRAPVTVSVKQVDGQTKMEPAEVYASTVNSVVSINTTATAGTNIFGQTVETASAGSGFIISSDGYIVTNYHVVKGATSVKVTLYSGDTYDATVIGGDSDYDVAVIKINASGLPAVTLGNSADVNVGDTVLAIGNPLGELTFSMSQGIVSCCDRAINVDGTPFNMIQVDASINPGNSGGPLVNLYGEVVGIVSAKYSSYSNTTVEGLGFAIPISDVRAIITDIIENGQVTGKAYLAIKAGTMTEQMAAQYDIDITEGVFVYSTESGGAGEKAGLQLGDVITKLNDTTITSMTDLTMAKKGYKAGDTVTLTVYRSGEYITLDLTFDQQPQTTGEDTEQDSQQNPQQGSDYSDLFRDFYNYYFGQNGR